MFRKTYCERVTEIYSFSKMEMEMNLLKVEINTYKKMGVNLLIDTP